MILTAVIAIAAVVLIFLYASIRILREYERGVVFTLGRYTGTKGPGLFLLVPFVQQMVRVDLRVVVDEVPPQDVISRDNVSVKVSAVIYFRVVDAERAIIQVSNYLVATSQLAQTTLRWVLGKHDLDQMLAERDKLNADIQEVLDKQTEGWGIKVSNVEIKRIDLDESMVRAIARQAEAERERRAKVINALGEQQAAQKLVEAARVLAEVPQAMQLRYLGTLFDIANERGSTIVFPIPIDMMQTFSAAMTGRGSPSCLRPRDSGGGGTTRRVVEGAREVTRRGGFKAMQADPFSFPCNNNEASGQAPLPPSSARFASYGWSPPPRYRGAGFIRGCKKV